MFTIRPLFRVTGATFGAAFVLTLFLAPGYGEAASWTAGDFWPGFAWFLVAWGAVELIAKLTDIK